MKKAGILNRDIASTLARMGHTDTIVIADCGLPIPDNTLCIDLSLKFGMPDFATVLAHRMMKGKVQSSDDSVKVGFVYFNVE